MENNQINFNSDESTNVSVIFARALSLIFKNNEGIVVDVPDDISKSFETSKVIVIKTNDKVSIFNLNEDIMEGTSVAINENND